MFFVYIIKSRVKDWHYVGISANLERRIEEHNTGKVKSTRYYSPFELVFVQILNNRLKARDFEKYLKIKWNKESLLEIIKLGRVAER